MHNNIKPAWIFCGVFLVTLLWAVEFDNRPRAGLANSSDHLHTSTNEQVTHIDPGNGQKSSELAMHKSQPAEVGTSGHNPQPHRNHSAGDYSYNLEVGPAYGLLPAQVQVFAAKGAQLAEQIRDNNPLHAAERLYSCFDNRCVNTDH
ncbi:hypothetical protein [Endozoicomonas sp. ONNA2]|uniref:hypothetical protein n=1 Tax=Endozoicomonas sp. ONNA2 TaxID=2828741 RepID=UPI002147FC65|nr:hypothetical protein [Endozoicomonas sp. ONNA2]